MLLRPLKSTIIISFFLFLNALIGYGVFHYRGSGGWGSESKAILSQVPSEMTQLSYYFVKDTNPTLSLSATSMRSLGNEIVSFNAPRGTYTIDKKKPALTYTALNAEYIKSQDQLTLQKEVEITHMNSVYQGDEMNYRISRDFLTGSGNIKIQHLMAKTGQRIFLTSERLEAQPRSERMKLMGAVDAQVKPRFNYLETLFLKAGTLELMGQESLIELRQDAEIKRGEMKISARNGDIFLEQENKKLKYFVMNDDVKMTEKMLDQQGRPLAREAFAERLEGFGQDKIVLSGAPRVVQGNDVIKGYMITLREKMEFIEVEDALSDVQVKKDENKKKSKE
ncbi:MAG: LptA/OstA family protein [Proteobacteria bacterium]|jgi:lipopolysaccharide export system protein LptA|nr:LptA/OstA family protein [Pseudomonadota bacterium]